jgi:transglutaminase-like putative cysteine protease
VRLRLTYRTRYAYEPPAAGGVTALRIRPRPRPGLAVHSSSIRVSPANGRLTGSYVDGWGTQTDVVEFSGAHRAAQFDLTAEVETLAAERLRPPTGDELALYRSDSAHVRMGAIGPLGWTVAGEGQSWTAIESVLAWFPQRFAYVVGETDADTPIEQVLAQGTGVCQDFAHVLLALVRSWGWCARYVSGYVFASDDHGDTVEAEAMHAWVEVFHPEAGWIGVDPTTGRLADERYVVVGYGRDYDDVRPVRGVILGHSVQTHSARLTISVMAPQAGQQQQ